jgi:hypothetical protein
MDQDHFLKWTKITSFRISYNHGHYTVQPMQLEKRRYINQLCKHHAQLNFIREEMNYKQTCKWRKEIIWIKRIWDTFHVYQTHLHISVGRMTSQCHASQVELTTPCQPYCVAIPSRRFHFCKIPCYSIKPGNVCNHMATRQYQRKTNTWENAPPLY